MLFLFCLRADWSQDQDSHGNDTESDDPSQLHSSQGWRECLHIRFVLFYKLVCLLIYISVYSITSAIWCGTHNRAGLQFKTVLTDNPPSPGEAGYTTGVYVPYSFRTVVWVLLRPTRTDKCECCETGPTVFPPYPRVESLTSFADVITKAALSPQLFKDPECLSGRGLNPRPPAQQQTVALRNKLTRCGCFCRFFSLT